MPARSGRRGVRPEASGSDGASLPERKSVNEASLKFIAALAFRPASNRIHPFAQSLRKGPSLGAIISSPMDLRPLNRRRGLFYLRNHRALLSSPGRHALVSRHHGPADLRDCSAAAGPLFCPLNFPVTSFLFRRHIIDQAESLHGVRKLARPRCNEGLPPK